MTSKMQKIEQVVKIKKVKNKDVFNYWFGQKN